MAQLPSRSEMIRNYVRDLKKSRQIELQRIEKAKPEIITAAFYESVRFQGNPKTTSPQGKELDLPTEADIQRRRILEESRVKPNVRPVVTHNA